MQKGPSKNGENPTIRGKSLIIYASGKGSLATDPAEGMSLATAEFLEYMKAYNSKTIDLRKYLEDWTFSHGEKRSTMWGDISLSTPFSLE